MNNNIILFKQQAKHKNNLLIVFVPFFIGNEIINKFTTSDIDFIFICHNNDKSNNPQNIIYDIRKIFHQINLYKNKIIYGRESSFHVMALTAEFLNIKYYIENPLILNFKYFGGNTVISHNDFSKFNKLMKRNATILLNEKTYGYSTTLKTLCKNINIIDINDDFNIYKFLCENVFFINTTDIDNKPIDNFNKYLINKEVIIKKNFIDKELYDIEEINNIKNKNIVIITSKIIVSEIQFTYCKKRSIYTKEERFSQTLDTITSVKKYIPDCHIILFDNSKFNSEEYSILKNNVDVFINITDDENLNHNTDVCNNKLVSELSQHISLYENYLKYINFSNNKHYFKITGRYKINDTFNYDNYDNNKNIFKMKDRNIRYYYTSFFKLDKNHVNYFYNNLKPILNRDYDYLKNFHYEQLIPKIVEDTIEETDNLGITQYISVWDEISCI